MSRPSQFTKPRSPSPDRAARSSADCARAALLALALAGVVALGTLSAGCGTCSKIEAAHDTAVRAQLAMAGTGRRVQGGSVAHIRFVAGPALVASLAQPMLVGRVVRVVDRQELLDEEGGARRTLVDVQFDPGPVSLEVGRSGETSHDLAVSFHVTVRVRVEAVGSRHTYYPTARIDAFGDIEVEDIDGGVAMLADVPAQEPSAVELQDAEMPPALHAAVLEIVETMASDELSRARSPIRFATIRTEQTRFGSLRLAAISVGVDPATHATAIDLATNVRTHAGLAPDPLDLPGEWSYRWELAPEYLDAGLRLFSATETIPRHFQPSGASAPAGSVHATFTGLRVDGSTVAWGYDLWRLESERDACSRRHVSLSGELGLTERGPGLRDVVLDDARSSRETASASGWRDSPLVGRSAEAIRALLTALSLDGEESNLGLRPARIEVRDRRITITGSADEAERASRPAGASLRD